MQHLGISPSELLRKVPADFDSPCVSLEAKQLRYDHYCKTLKATVKEIQRFLRHKGKQRMRSVQRTRDSTPPPPGGALSTRSVHRSSLRKLRAKNKHALEALLTDIDQRELDLQMIQNRLQRASPKYYRNEAKQATVDAFKRIQQENFQRKCDQFEAHERNAAKLVTRYESPPTKPVVHSPIIIKKRIDDSGSASHRLAEIQQRLDRSAARHDLNLQTKRQAAAKLGQKTVVKPVEAQADIVEKICKIWDSRRTSEGRRQQVQQQKKGNLEVFRVKHEQRRKQALSKLSHDEDIQHAKARALEKRMNSFGKILEKRRKKVAKEIARKSELSRLRDLDASMKTRRKRRAMVRSQ